jgi:subtilisin family serine protease
MHSKTNRTWHAALLALGVLATTLAISGTAQSQSQSDGAVAPQAGQDTSSAIVQLTGDPLSTAVQTRPSQGKKINFNNSSVKAYRAQLSALRNQYKQWLHANVPQANVTSEFDIALNAVAVQLNGATLQQISATPLVTSAAYENLYYPVGVQDPDLGLIQAISAWQEGGGASTAGAGVKVAIVDTGIDITHPCFDDTGYAPQTQLGDRKFTNNKVIAAKVFNNRIQTQHYTPEALQDHGTHVSGTVACNLGTKATVGGVAIPFTISGVAPNALLGNYNIFPGQVADARSEDIFQALEAAYSDGFDVANMSLGGGQKGVQDLVMAAVDRLDKANMVVAIAAGNSGPGYQTVSSPGSAARALTAGASTVPHYVGAPVTINGNSYGALPGDFATVASDVTAPLAVVMTGGTLDKACNALTPGSLTSKIALISRGTCSFSTKIRNAQNAGAVTVLVVNNAIGDPIQMGTDGTPNQPTTPAYMLSQTDGLALVGSNGLAATISATMAYFQTPNGDLMASFSGWGPTMIDFRIKPDVVAPGVQVLSSIPHQFCATPPCFAFFQGTSMATPHLAGSAAVLIGQHPDWSAAEVRSAIVNTADRVLKDWVVGAPLNDVNITGAGRENLLSATNAQVALDPVSVSFGAVPTGSGQTNPVDVTLTNLSSASVTWSVATSGGDASVAYNVSPESVTLAAGASTVVTVVMSAAKGAALGGHQGSLEITDAGGTPVAHAAVYTLIK